MSGNVELVQKFVADFNGGDFEGALAALDTDVEMRGPPDVPEPGPFLGREAVRDWLDGFMDAWEHWQAEVLDVKDREDQVLVEMSQRGRARGSGIDVTDLDFHVFTIRNGKIIRWSIHNERDQALTVLNAGFRR
jgi:ketosteroid isomerase-like protein